MALSGAADYFVNVQHRTWANGILEPGNNWSYVYSGPTGYDPVSGRIENPNNWTISIETEDLFLDGVRPPQPVSAGQYVTTLGIIEACMRRYPSIRWLLLHRDISPHSRVNCAGPRWVDSGKYQALQDATGLRAVA